MQVKENINKGLKRELKIIIAKKDMIEKRDARLEDIKDKVKINGFRPGKVPMAHVTKMYGKSVMAELVDEVVRQNTQKALDDRKEKAVQQPKITMTEDEKEADIILNGEKDFEFTVAYEIMPEFKLADFKKYKIEKPIVEVTKEEVKNRMEEMAQNSVAYEKKKGSAKKEDRVVFDYAGKVDGVEFEGGTDTNAHLVLGSNTFIPGFEDQLMGKSAGDKIAVKVTFPKEYPAENLAGKKAVFEVLIHKVESPVKAKLDDEFAKTLGVESFKKLEELVSQQIESQYEQQSKERIKKQLLEEINKTHKFELPPDMVKQEFESMWQQVQSDMERNKKTFKDMKTTEAKERKKYEEMSERRVRLGLVMGKVGEQEKIEVTEEEIQRALYEQAQRYPGQEKEIFEFFKKNPEQVASLKMPIYEDKVISHILENVTMKDKKISKEELLKIE